MWSKVTGKRAECQEFIEIHGKNIQKSHKSHVIESDSSKALVVCGLRGKFYLRLVV